VSWCLGGKIGEQSKLKTYAHSQASCKSKPRWARQHKNSGETRCSQRQSAEAAFPPKLAEVTGVAEKSKNNVQNFILSL
jgi:hypothetical protein